MAIKYAATKFPQMEIGNLLAQDYGEHILSVKITEDTPNGYHFKPGKMTSLDNWEMEAATEIDAYIAMKDASGRYLVVIRDPKGVGVIRNLSTMSRVLVHSHLLLISITIQQTVQFVDTCFIHRIVIGLQKIILMAHLQLELKSQRFLVEN